MGNLHKVNQIFINFFCARKYAKLKRKLINFKKVNNIFDLLLMTCYISYIVKALKNLEKFLKIFQEA